MANFLKETIAALAAIGRTPADVISVGDSKYRIDWDTFAANANFEYDDGFGAPYIFGHSLIKRFINGVCRAKCSDPRGWEPTRDEYTDIGFKAGFYALVHGHNEEAFMRDFIRFWSDYNDWKQHNR